MLAAGDLDTTFGVGGVALTDFGSLDDEATAVAVQPDGKLVVVGYATNDGNSDFAIARYNLNGSLDTSFSGDGLQTTDFGFPLDQAADVAIQPDGKIVVVGRNSNSANANFTVARYLANGQLDNSFNEVGKISTDFDGAEDNALSVALQFHADEWKIIAAGSAMVADEFRVALARYRSNGTLDTSFGNGGIQHTNVGPGHDSGRSVAVLPDGGILVGGRAGSFDGGDFALVKYDSNGQQQWVRTASMGINDDALGMSLQTDDSALKVVLAGRTHNGVNSDIAVARFDIATETLDATFGNGGTKLIDLGGNEQAKGLTVQTDGKIVLTGSTSSDGGKTIIVRLEPDGALDATFSGNGVAETALGIGGSSANDVAITPDGKIVAVGVATISADNTAFAVVRYIGGLRDPQTLHWQGDIDSNWSLPGNWLENLSPIDGDSLVFDTRTSGIANFNTVNDLIGLSLATIETFDDSAAGNYAIGGNAITLAGGISVDGGASDFLGVHFHAINLAASQSFTIDTVLTSFTSHIFLSTNDLVLTGTRGQFHSGVISGDGDVTVSGPTTFNAPNTYTGFTTVTSLLALQVSGTLGDTTNGTILDNATLDLSTGIVNAEALTLQGSFASIRGRDGSVQSGDVTLNTLTETRISWNSSIDDGTFIVSGDISGNAGTTGLRISTETSDRVVLLSGDNTYTGATTIASGIVRLGDFSVFPDSSALTVITGATLDMTIYGDRIGSLAGGGTVLLGSAPLEFGDDNTSTTFSGTMSRSGQVVKNGTGTFTLTGILLDQGNLTINSGVFRLGGANRIADNRFVAMGLTGRLDLNSFDETIGGLSSGIGPQVTLGSGTLTVGGMGIDSTFFGTISGSGGLTKTGPGRLTFFGANGYFGATNIDAGTLALGASGVIQDGSAILVAAGATFDLSGAPVGSTELVGSLAGAGNVTLGSTTLRAGGNNASTTFSGVISGARGLTKDGTGTMTLTGANSYTGNTTIFGGTLRIGALASVPDPSLVFIAGGAVFDLNGHDETIGGLRGLPQSQVLLGTATLTIGFGNSGSDFEGEISGSGSLVKTGTGGQRLMSANTYTGQTRVDQGELVVEHASALGASTTGTIVAAGATLLLQPTTGLSIDEPLELAGGSVLKNRWRNSVWAGQVTLAGDATMHVEADSLEVTGSIRGGSGFTKTGAGTLIVSGANLYQGATTINAGTLAVGVSGAMADLSAVTVNSGATFDLSALPVGSTEIVGSLAGSGAVQLGSSTLGAGGNNSSTIFSGVMSGARGLSKFGTGAITLTGANNYTGNTTIFGGTLRLGASGSIPDPSLLFIATGAVFDLNGHDETIGALRGLPQSQALLGSGTLTIGFGNAGSDFEGEMSGSGSLVKIGTGGQRLMSANTYTGETRVDQGELIIEHPAALGGAGTGTVVAAGATLLLQPTTGLSIDEPLELAGGSVLKNRWRNNIWAGPVTLTGDATILVDADSLTVAGAIGGTGGLAKTGTGTLVLTGANTYAGATDIERGVLVLPAVARFGNPNLVSVAPEGELILEGNDFHDTIATVAGASATVVEVLLNGQSRGIIDATGPVRIRGLAGDDTFNIAASGGAGLLLDGQEHYDYYDVSLGGLNGPVFINDSGSSGTGSGSLSVAATTASETVLISGSQISLAGAPSKSVHFDGNLEILSVDGITGSDQILVNSGINWSGLLFTLRAQGAGSTITVSAPINLGSGNVQLRAADGVILSGPDADITTTGGFFADADTDSNAVGAYTQNDVGSTVFTGPAAVIAADVNLAGTINSNNATSGSLQLEASTANRTIGLGDGAVGDFNLSTAELLNLTAGNVVSLGRFNGTGAVDIGNMDLTSKAFPLLIRGGTTTFSGPANLSGALHFFSTGAIIDNHPGEDVNAQRLLLSAASSIGAAGDPLETRVAVLAAQNTSSGDISIENSGNLSVGSVFGIDGVSNSGGSVALYQRGDLTIENTAAANDVASNAAILLQLFGFDSKLTISAGADVQSVAGTHDYIADKMDLAGTITATGRRVGLAPERPGRLINLGSPTDAVSNVLELSDAEIDRVTADRLQIGSRNTGPMAISSRVDPAGTSTLHLISGGSIDDGASGQLLVSNLALESNGAVTLDGYTIDNPPITNFVYSSVQILAGRGSSFVFDNRGALTIGTVDGVSGVSTSGGGISISTHSPLIIDQPVQDTGGGSIVLTAFSDEGDSDHLTINSSVQAAGGDGNVHLIAGTDVIINSGAMLSTEGSGNIDATANRTTALSVSASITTQGGIVIVASQNLVVSDTTPGDQLELQPIGETGDVGILLNGLSLTYSPNGTGGQITTVTENGDPNAAPHDVLIDPGVQEHVFAVGIAMPFAGSFADADLSNPNAAVTQTAEWRFRSTSLTAPITRVGTVSNNAGSGQLADMFAFTQPGVYHAKLTIRDGVATISSEEVTFVVYDPSAGFVTGGGWIDSPAGAYVSDPTLTGKATFGFVSQYKKGATTPTGQTEFQFKTANLNFHSSSYDWLVVAGARAQYKGTGTINGAGNYGFMLTAVDGQINGGGGLDKFRIKIWDKNNGDSIVYDNQIGADDDATPTTGLGGGQIVIHNNAGSSGAAVSKQKAIGSKVAGLAPLLGGSAITQTNVREAIYSAIESAYSAASVKLPLGIPVTKWVGDGSTALSKSPSASSKTASQSYYSSVVARPSGSGHPAEPTSPVEGHDRFVAFLGSRNSDKHTRLRADNRIEELAFILSS
ncbi:MAG: autotransporter-associated beta strand repeat-containing protein [Pirellulales bacterium]